MHCVACGTDLEPEFAGIETKYQFDNALWIAFHGADGMFVDNIHATMPVNMDESQWLNDEAGEPLIDGEGRLMSNPDWQPVYEEERTLPGRPDYEAVICHECAHQLCETVPWIERLLEPLHSHSHKSQVCDELFAAGHIGWNFGNCHLSCMWRTIGRELERAARQTPTTQSKE